MQTTGGRSIEDAFNRLDESHTAVRRIAREVIDAAGRRARAAKPQGNGKGKMNGHSRPVAGPVMVVQKPAEPTPDRCQEDQHPSDPTVSPSAH